MVNASDGHGNCDPFAFCGGVLQNLGNSFDWWIESCRTGDFRFRLPFLLKRIGADCCVPRFGIVLPFTVYRFWVMVSFGLNESHFSSHLRFRDRWSACQAN